MTDNRKTGGDRKAGGDRKTGGAKAGTDTQAAASGEVVPLRKGGGRCPICNKPSQTGYRPFCSRRCADVDLNRWLGEGYRIPTEEPADPEALFEASRRAERDDDER